VSIDTTEIVELLRKDAAALQAEADRLLAAAAILDGGEAPPEPATPPPPKVQVAELMADGLRRSPNVVAATLHMSTLIASRCLDELVTAGELMRVSPTARS
jgi:hypothetical protein